MRSAIRSTLFATLALALSGGILGFMHTSENEWVWMGGFVAIGVVTGVLLGLMFGNLKKILTLSVLGGLIGLIGRWLISTSNVDLWLQITIIGAVGGAYIGLAFGLFGPVSQPKEKLWKCDECGAKIKQTDNYCPNCGSEFE